MLDGPLCIRPAGDARRNHLGDAEAMNCIWAVRELIAGDLL
jgi:hypothetical protein